MFFSDISWKIDDCHLFKMDILQYLFWWNLNKKCFHLYLLNRALVAKYTNTLYSVKQKEGKRLRVIYMSHNNESEEIKNLRNKCRCNSSLTHGCRLLLKESRRPTLCQLLTDSRKANESERTPYNLPSTVNQII